MAGHSDTQCKTEIRRDISDSLLRDECFVQPIICFAKFRGLYLYLHFRFVLIRGVHFVYVTLCVHVFLHFGTFGLEVLQLIVASKLSELEQFENFAANDQFRKQKRVKMTPKSN